MSFKNYVCWDINRVRGVMNTNAELASRDIFLAVHSEYPLAVANPREGYSQASPDRTLDPHSFLQAFLSEDNPHMQVAVLGDSGSGKSHLIRWMELSMPARRDRYVISIPRSGISLRGVIERILTALPEGDAQPYRDRLDQAGDVRSTPQQLEERLLSEIGLAIAAEDPSADGDPDIKAALIEELPNIFHDPYLRTHFRETGEVIGQLATQVLSASNEYLPVGQRREFSVEDLPLTGIQLSNMSSAARDVCDFLRSDPASQLVAVELINRNLNRAIGQVLNFTGDRLIMLLGDVRRHLRAQGQELVLLVEDLARLQGLDLSLLEALIEEGNEANGLCTLRWAAAVTTGYYSRIPDTVKTRMAFVLNMGLPIGGGHSTIDEESIIAFSVKYLNAARLHPEALFSWARLPDDQREAPPVACVSCPHRASCHSIFGSVDGVGLYPFNRDALLNMLRRLDSRIDERFSPRILVKEVLAEVLGTYGRDLTNDRFPSRQLLGQMEGTRLPPVVADGLRRQDSEQAERQLTVLELWGSEGSTVTDLPEDLYASFGLTKPTIQGARLPEVAKEQQAKPRETTESDSRIRAIRDWGNGAPMQDGLMNYVRPLLFTAITSHIDWDNEAFVQNQFSSTSSGSFRQDSISFLAQLTQPALRPVNLKIPMKEGHQELAEAAIAIEGLYRFRQHGNWDFPYGPRLLESLANCLDEWSNHVVQQMRCLQEFDGNWDTTAAAVEMLAVGAALAGRPPRRSATLIDWLNALFEEWPHEIPAQSPEWLSLYRSVRSEQTRLKNLALARASGTKGGQRGAFIDPTKLLPPLRRVRRRWELIQRPPDGTTNRRDDYGALARLHTKISSELTVAAKSEWSQRTDWVTEWRNSVPEGPQRKEVVDTVRELMNLAIDTGVGFSPRVRNSIESALVDLEGVQLDDALRFAATLQENEEPVVQLPELGRNRGGNARVAVRKFLPAVHELLSQLEASVASRMAQFDQSGKDLQGHQTQIKKALHQLSCNLETIGGGDAGTV